MFILTVSTPYAKLSQFGFNVYIQSKLLQHTPVLSTLQLSAGLSV